MGKGTAITMLVTTVFGTCAPVLSSLKANAQTVDTNASRSSISAPQNTNSTKRNSKGTNSQKPQTNANTTQTPNSQNQASSTTDSQSDKDQVHKFNLHLMQGKQEIKNIELSGKPGEEIELQDYLPEDFEFEKAEDATYIVDSEKNDVEIQVVVKANESQNGQDEPKTPDKNTEKSGQSNGQAQNNNQDKKADNQSKPTENQKQSQLNEDKTAQKVRARQTVPVPATPMPSQKTLEQRKEVTNPMLRPDDSSDKIDNASQFESQVPFNDNDVQRDLNKVKPYKDYDKSVLRWMPYLKKVTKQYKMTKYTDLFLAIMENESKGNGQDIMQSSESAGLAPNSLNQHQSIEQAVRYMKSITKKAKEMDKAERKNPFMPKEECHDYATDNRLLAQTYAFGPGFLDYIAKQKDGYTFKNTEKYSRTVIAPALGNKTGKKYKYSNNISKMYHKEYLYRNGGNFFYGDLTAQYMVTGYMRTIMKEMIKYSGQDYVWGGKNPQMGFDCSGLTSYGLNQVGVNVPSYTVSQWNMLKHVKRLNKAKPGDLIFFKGTYGAPDFISHVEFVIDRHTMFGSNSSGVGFHNIDEKYWHEHYAGVRRVKNARQLNKIAEQELDQEVQAVVADKHK
jgi:hypothetical protein